MNVLPGQKLKPKYYVPIEDQLQSIFYDILFQPLLDIASTYTSQIKVGERGLQNAPDNALQMALRTGRIQYQAGVFSGQFNAAIARQLDTIGAKYDAQSKVYRMAPINVPGWVRGEAANYQQIAKTAHDSIMRRIDDIQRNLDDIIDGQDIYAGRTIQAIQKDFENVTKSLTVMPTLSDDSRARLAADYNQNMKLWIKKFSEKTIKQLRTDVQKNATAGYRFDELIDTIKSRYGVSQNKAKFLARQETSLFMAKYREQRFGDAGVKRYVWRTSHDARVRPMADVSGRARLNDHRDLDGRIFLYSNPPIVNKANGKRANPGQDWGCRCVDEPILD